MGAPGPCQIRARTGSRRRITALTHGHCSARPSWAAAGQRWGRYDLLGGVTEPEVPSRTGCSQRWRAHPGEMCCTGAV